MRVPLPEPIKWSQPKRYWGPKLQSTSLDAVNAKVTINPFHSILASSSKRYGFLCFFFFVFCFGCTKLRTRPPTKITLAAPSASPPAPKQPTSTTNLPWNRR